MSDAVALMIEQRADLTFKYNLKQGRHGWIRLTPAYSIKIVRQILDENPDMTYVLDPFSGTGTTGLVCAERAVRCDLLDINPFLVWFAKAKTANYRFADLQLARESATLLCRYAEKLPSRNGFWTPPIHNLQRWWPESRLDVLARLYEALSQQFPARSPVKDVSLIAFCNLIISWSNAAFNHQSLSFKENDEQQLSLFDEEQQIYTHFVDLVSALAKAAEDPLSGKVTVRQADSRHIPPAPQGEYDGVITSPPYPNRMSYIRELRPYMYWLGYLKDGREAGELDWQAIGGTWGIATSRLETWKSQIAPFLDSEFQAMIAAIAQKGPTLAKYVQRYFVDIASHLQSLYPVLRCGAKVFYIVGNSRFYDTLVPVEQIYAKLLEANGFVDTSITAIRKRNSKKELFEYIVAATKDKSSGS